MDGATAHYTNKSGFDAIGSVPTWTFEARKPPDAKPRGAYFTSLGPDTPNLAQRLRIPRVKLEYHFTFRGRDGLRRLEGGRGDYIFYSPEDYQVSPERQSNLGKTGLQ